MKKKINNYCEICQGNHKKKSPINPKEFLKRSLGLREIFQEEQEYLRKQKQWYEDYERIR